LKKEEKDYDSCAQDALNYVQSKAELAFLEMDEKKVDELNRLYRVLEMYFEHYQSDIRHWEILDVEGFHLLEWGGEDRVYLPMSIDLVIYQRGGKFKGEISPVDHKFVNDFWSPWKFRLNSQLPLYIRALRATRFSGKAETVVKRSVVNQIRTRKIEDPYPSELFRRSFIDADANAMELIFENHLKTALESAELKRLPAGEAFQKTVARWGSSDCQFCHFKSVCATQLEGGNVDMTIAAEYQASTYGYPSMKELKSER